MASRTPNEPHPKETYYDKMRQQLEEMEAELAAREEDRAVGSGLRQYYEAARDALERLKTADADDWQEHRASVEKHVEQLQNALEDERK